MAHVCKVWVEAYYPDGTQILGNGDGQGAINAREYRRTNFYRHLRGAKLPGWPQWKRPAFWRIVTEQGLPLETMQNPYAPKEA